MKKRDIFKSLDVIKHQGREMTNKGKDKGKARAEGGRWEETKGQHEKQSCAGKAPTPERAALRVRGKRKKGEKMARLVRR